MKFNNIPISSMRLFIGLGNPGERYRSTRHNIGFYVLDRLTYAFNVSFTSERKFLGDYAKIGKSLFLLKPMTYMNGSGQSVNAFMKFYRLVPEQILVVHDELDLMPGQFKFKKNGGHAGHNGLKSIQETIGNRNFWRLRIGIGHPRTIKLMQRVDDYVLSPSGKQDQKFIENIIDHFCHMIFHSISEENIN